jgi:hypothetical protein
VDSVTVHYPLHPYYQLTLPVLRTIKSGIVHVRAPDGTMRGLPVWMTQKDTCIRIIPSTIPYCSVDGLRELRALLSSVRKSGDNPAAERSMGKHLDSGRASEG